MRYKRLIPCIFIKDGKAVRWIDDPTVVSKDVIELAKYYSDHGADELIVLDLSDSDEEHDETDQSCDQDPDDRRRQYQTPGRY